MSFKQRGYIEFDVELYEKTGHIVCISPPIYEEDIRKGFFEFTVIKNVIKLLQLSEGKRVRVVCYLLLHKDTNNIVCDTYKKIAADIGVTRQMVSEAIRDYINAGLMKKNGDKIMINPRLFSKGRKLKLLYLDNLYRNFDKQEEIKVGNKGNIYKGQSEEVV